MKKNEKEVNLLKLITFLSWPIMAIWLAKRKEKQKEDLKRFPERLGIASIKRPKGKLIWLHGASVGEGNSALIVIDKIKKQYPDFNFLLTTGSKTSGELFSKKKGIIHQYVPVDFSFYVKNFLNYWKPDLSIRIESDFWPTLTRITNEYNIPIILLNGKVTESSFKKYKKVPKLIKSVFDCFDLSFAKSKEEVEKFSELGLKNIKYLGNIKFAADALSYDKKEYNKLRQETSNKKIWAAASTHPGEDEIIINIHKELKKENKNILTIVIPRHINRADNIETLIQKAGICYQRRTKSASINKDTEIYLADTMGEMGLFYMLSDIALVCGSLIKIDGIGGHNPIEPALLDNAVITGKYISQWKPVYDEMEEAKSVIIANNKKELIQNLKLLFKNKTECAKLIKNGKNFALSQKNVMNRILKEMKPYLEKISKNK